ncbi:MAG TPA: hypothetical protein VK879_19015 [Candidatus Sulfomarinibacteraceae bacterium]|nr:hypothetical protein [Candidatus Sulfomarinibacteraceae bacterium]
MELQAVTGKLYMREGEPQQTTAIPGLLAQAPPAKAVRGRTRDFLFVHLSLSGQPDTYKNLAEDLLDALSKRFYSSAGSVTASLRQSILEANQLLLRQNLSRSGPAREGALTCAVLRENELFVVQAGEALALIGRNFGLERLPAHEPDQVTPLGRTAGLDLRYFHNWLESGDMLLLADPRVTHLPQEALKPVLIDSTVEDSLPQLAQLLDRETARMLIVEFTDETPVGIPDSVIPLGSQQRRTQPSSGPSGRALSPPERQPQRAQAGPTTQPSPLDRVRSASLPDIDLPSATTVEDTARRASSQTAMGLSRVTGWLADLMSRLRPAGSGEADEGEQPGWALPAMLAVLIPLIVALVVGGVYVQRGRVARIGEIRSEMRQALIAGQETGNEMEARQQYEQALTLAAEADMLRPGDDEIDRLRRQAQTALDSIDDVTRLSSEILYEYPEGSQMTGVVLRAGFNGDIYTLDGGNNRVFVHDTEEDYLTFVSEHPEEILFGGQAVGSHVVGQLLDLMWRPNGSQVTDEGVAVLDARGALLTYHPGFSNVRSAPLGLASDWGRPVAITQFNERLYVLDSGTQQIWRYFPEGNGFYVDEGQRALSLPDLDAATDVAIYSEDGSVIVLYGDGRLRRYGQDSVLWDEASLADSGLDTPLVAPTRVRIIGSGLNSSIFVADPGSARIVQLSLGGTFLAQYKARTPQSGEELFANLGDFDVAETPLRIFVTADNALYVATQE